MPSKEKKSNFRPAQSQEHVLSTALQQDPADKWCVKNTNQVSV